MNVICCRDFKPIGGFSRGKYFFAMIVEAKQINFNKMPVQ